MTNTSPTSKEQAELILSAIFSHLCEEIAVISVGEIEGKRYHPAYNLLVSMMNDELSIHTGDDQSMNKELFLDILAHDLEESKDAKAEAQRHLSLMIFGRDGISVLKNIDNMNISYPDTARMWTLKHGSVEPTRHAFMYEWNGSEFEQGPDLIDGEMDFYGGGYEDEYDTLTELGREREEYYRGFLTPETTAQAEEVAIIKARSIAAAETATRFLRDIVFTNAPVGNHHILMRDAVETLEVNFSSSGEVVFADVDIEEFHLSLASSLALDLNVEIILTSFLGENPYVKDKAELCMPSSPQEIRGWLFCGTQMIPYIADEIIDISCTDSEGKITSPNPNASYKTAWIYPAPK